MMAVATNTNVVQFNGGNALSTSPAGNLARRSDT